MFGAYFDASGTHQQSNSITVAGVVAPALRWKTFDSKWWNILEAAGIEPDDSEYRVFHMTDYNGGWGKFAGWDTPKKKFVIKKLVRAMGGRIRIAVAKSVNKVEFERVKAEFSSFHDMSPFTFCFIQCLIELSNIFDEMGTAETVAYGFEQGDGYGFELDLLKRAVERDHFLREKFRWESFTNSLEKRKYPALQAADIVAFEGQKEMLNYIVPGKALVDTRKSLVALRKAFKEHDGWLKGGPISEEELRSIAPGFVGPKMNY